MQHDQSISLNRPVTSFPASQTARPQLNPVCKQTYFVWLSVCMLLMHAQTSRAQFEQLTYPNKAEADSSKGYWRLKTLAASRSTLVQFFGPAGQLLYEENLPEKWVKLSRKNQKQFDQLLEQLLANQLLSSRIKTELLPPTPVLPTRARTTIRTSDSPNATSATYRVHAYVNPSGKLYLIVDNPDQLRYKILVADQQNRPLYEEFTNHEQYRRKLDLSALPNNAWQVTVQIDKKPYIYKVRKQEARFAYSILPESIISEKETTDPKQDDNKPVLNPVTIDL
ncbi:hypothetical protein [Spirosoma sp. KNUC1025]|uniref:hypothetical protein n=1 Tax=Spirosoma sp. KNUC1025 TaxID=2894082 RepID=UPI0038697B00|nr:hypothetical protein LN737_14195 [Spirosoma sp. KNUC1025]